MKTTHYIKHSNHNLEIEGEYIKEVPGDHETQTEPHEFNINVINLGEFDITEMLENDMEYLEKKVLELFYS